MVRRLLRAYLPESPLTLKAFSETWLNASSACNNTKRVYRSCIRKSIDYFGTDTDIRIITHSKLCLLYKNLPYSIKGKYNVLTTLKSMLNFAVKDGIIKKIPPFPALSIGLPDEIEYLTYEQQKCVLAAITERHRPIFEFGMEFGLRIGEVRAIKKDAIQDGMLIVRRSFSQFELRETTKKKRVRRLPLTAKANEILQNAATSFSDFVFTFNGKTPYYERKLREIWKAACAQAGIKIELYNAFRHSLGSQLLDEGHPLELVQDVLGDTSATMTRRYARRNPAQIKSALENRGKVVDFTARLLHENLKVTD